MTQVGDLDERLLILFIPTSLETHLYKEHPRIQQQRSMSLMARDSITSLRLDHILLGSQTRMSLVFSLRVSRRRKI